LRRLGGGFAIAVVLSVGLYAAGPDGGPPDFAQCVQCCVGALRQDVIEGSEVKPCADACVAGQPYVSPGGAVVGCAPGADNTLLLTIIKRP
jgi:hypothetical protein